MRENKGGQQKRRGRGKGGGGVQLFFALFGPLSDEHDDDDDPALEGKVLI